MSKVPKSGSGTSRTAATLTRLAHRPSQLEKDFSWTDDSIRELSRLERSEALLILGRVIRRDLEVPIVFENNPAQSASVNDDLEKLIHQIKLHVKNTNTGLGLGNLSDLLRNTKCINLVTFDMYIENEEIHFVLTSLVGGVANLRSFSCRIGSKAVFSIDGDLPSFLCEITKCGKLKRIAISAGIHFTEVRDQNRRSKWVYDRAASSVAANSCPYLETIHLGTMPVNDADLAFLSSVTASTDGKGRLNMIKSISLHLSPMTPSRINTVKEKIDRLLVDSAMSLEKLNLLVDTAQSIAFEIPALVTNLTHSKLMKVVLDSPKGTRVILKLDKDLKKWYESKPKKEVIVNGVPLEATQEWLLMRPAEKKAFLRKPNSER